MLWLRNARDLGLIPRSGRSLRGVSGNPLQYSCLENPMDRGAWQATVHGVTKSRTQLNNFYFIHFFFLWLLPTPSVELILFAQLLVISLNDGGCIFPCFSSSLTKFCAKFTLPGHCLPAPGDPFYPLLYCSVCVPRNCSPLWS